MSCPSELELAAHADGEAAVGGARLVEEHLATCPRCRRLVEALRGEGRLLARVLEEAVPEPASDPRTEWTGLLTAGLTLFAAAAGIQAFLGWADTLVRESPAGVFDARSFVVSALFETFVYLLREGASMLNWLLETLGLVALGLLATAAGLSLRRRLRAGSLLLLAVVGLAVPATALERRVARGDRDAAVVVRVDETVDDSLLAVGETVSVDGVVTGNLIACARRVTVRGTVKGDVLAAAQRIEVEGAIEGNVVTFSETVVVRGPVGRSLHSFAQHVGLERQGRVEGDVVTFAKEADFDGGMGRDLLAFGGRANVRGSVARNASAWTHRLRVEAPARIGGDLTAHAERKDDVVVDPQVTVTGKTQTLLSARRHGSRYARPSFYVWRVVWLAAAFVTGLLAHRLFPSLFAGRLGGGGTILKWMAIGFVVLVAAPAAAALVGITMVGLPLALVALGLWATALYLASILVGALLGRMLLDRGPGGAPPFALLLITGLLAVTVVGNLPYVGGLVRFFILLLGLGTGALQVAQLWRRAPTGSTSSTS